MIPRLYVPEHLQAGQTLDLSEGQRRYLQRTLRLQAGAQVILFNGLGEEGEWHAVLSGAGVSTQLWVQSFHRTYRESCLAVTLVHGMAKMDAMEMVIQKSVELGVKAVIPLVTRRSVNQPASDRWANKAKRWQKIAEEAAEQSGRAWVPIIHPPQHWSNLEGLLPEGSRYLFWENPKEQRRLGQQLLASKSVTLLIGPEGGFDPEEVHLARDLLGFTTLSLGPRILRTETAAISVLTAVQILWGDMG